MKYELYRRSEEMVHYVYRKKNGAYAKGAMSITIAESMGLSPCDAPAKEFKDYRLTGWSGNTQYFFETRGK